MLGTETVRVRRRGGTDPDGDPLPAAAPWAVDGCLVEPITGAELLAVAIDGATNVARVFVPLTDGIDNTCEIEIRGRWYRTIGDVVAYVNDEDPELSGYSLTCTRGTA